METWSAFLRVVAFMAGVYLGVALIVVLDVQLTLAAIDLSDPTTLPEMGPQFRYLVIPIGGTAVLLVALVLDHVIGRTLRLELRRPSHALVQGMSYSLFLVFFPLSHIARGPWSLVVAVPLAVAAAVLVRRVLGVSASGAGA